MKKAFIVLCFLSGLVFAQADFTDTIITEKGEIQIHFLGHSSLMLVHEGNNIYIDPFSRLSDYSKLPKADYILITHEHGDHWDLNAVNQIMTDSTILIYTEACSEKLPGGNILKNGECYAGIISVLAVPAYNIAHKRPDGNPYHPEGRGNGYVITIADINLYIAGDTENIPEIKNFENIYAAFLPVNLPYTMSAEMAADAVKTIRPKIFYPYHYHFGETDISKLRELLKDETDIEIRIPYTAD